MPRPLDLSWKAAPCRLGPLSWLGLGIAMALLVASFAAWWSAHHRMHILSEQRAKVDYMAAPVRAVLSDKAKRDISDEISALSQPIQQLNQRWDVLLGELKPARTSVKVVEVEVDAQSRRIRLIARATRLNYMVDYAAELAGRASVKEVALVRHEPDKEDGGYRFTVEALWVAGR